MLPVQDRLPQVDNLAYSKLLRPLNPRLLQRLLHSSEAATAGVIETTAFQLWSERHDDPEWRDIVPHFHRLTSAEIAPYNATGYLP